MKVYALLLSLFMGISASFAAAPSETSIAPGCPVELIYSGYDILQANPTYSDDSGWRDSIFANAEPFVTCIPTTVMYSYQHALFSTEQNYHQYLLRYVNFRNPIVLENKYYTASREFEYQRQEVFNQNLLTLQAHTGVQVLHGGLSTSFGAEPEKRFAPDFLKAVADFPSSSHDPDWLSKANAFFTRFGTHYINFFDFGAMWSYEMQFTPENYAYARSTGDLYYGLYASAEYTRTGGASAAHESSREKNARIMVESLAVLRRHHSQGVPPTHDLSASDWRDAAKENPEATYLELSPISELFTSYHFPNDPDIDAKRLLMMEAYSLYCDSLEYCHDI